MSDVFDELGPLAAELKAAMAEHAHAAAASTEAGRVECRATNRLTAAQRAFDEAVAKLRAGAPWNTPWHKMKT